MNEKFKEFEPHRWLRSGHLQTMAGSFLRRKFALPEGEERLFRVDAETQLKGICHWHREEAGSRTRPGRFEDRPLRGGEERLFRVDAETQLKGICHWQREEAGSRTRPGRSEVRPLHGGKRRLDLPVIVIVHGLEGSCDSNYMRGIADKAWARGFHAVRMNQRNCGGTEQLTPTLYNSGLSGDYRVVLLELIAQGFTQIYFAGYSMGGNLVTKMAGEWGAAPPKELRGVCAVCPAMDLSACADALGDGELFVPAAFCEGIAGAIPAEGGAFSGAIFEEWIRADPDGAGI